MTLYGTDTVKDVAESVGITNLNKDVTSALCRDIEYRLSIVLETAMKFMRHSQRTILWSDDIKHALQQLQVEPLYGYDSVRPLRYGEASIGPGQPLFYVEDEEMDFEKLINAPLPKVPREMSFTAHWLAVEGVQPSIPQNPTSTESRNLELLPKGPNTNANLSAMAHLDNTTTKPQVKHILSKELQLYFEKVCKSVLDEQSPEYRSAGLASLREDPGLHQLVPYFVQFVAEKVTHGLKDLFVLEQMMMVIDALTHNDKLNLIPYVASLVPPVLTCMIGRTLGQSTSNTSPLDHFNLRELAASLLKHLCQKYAKYSHNLKPRLARSCLKTFLDPRKPLGSHYGAILGFEAIGGGEIVRSLVVPNLKEYEEILQAALSGSEGDVKRAEGETVVNAIMRVLAHMMEEDVPYTNGQLQTDASVLTDQLVEKVGEVIGRRIVDSGNTALAKSLLE